MKIRLKFALTAAALLALSQSCSPLLPSGFKSTTLQPPITTVTTDPLALKNPLGPQPLQPQQLEVQSATAGPAVQPPKAVDPPPFVEDIPVTKKLDVTLKIYSLQNTIIFFDETAAVLRALESEAAHEKEMANTTAAQYTLSPRELSAFKATKQVALQGVVAIGDRTTLKDIQVLYYVSITSREAKQSLGKEFDQGDFTPTLAESTESRFTLSIPEPDTRDQQRASKLVRDNLTKLVIQYRVQNRVKNPQPVTSPSPLEQP